MYDAQVITNYILSKSVEQGFDVTNLSLQKLLYFLHGWFFSIFNEPLIKSDFEAWQYGPVQRPIYEEFKKFGAAPIKQAMSTKIDPETGARVVPKLLIELQHLEVLSEILKKYQNHSANALVTESHVEEGPWEYVWKQTEDVIYPGMKIPSVLIKDHFSRLKPIITIN